MKKLGPLITLTATIILAGCAASHKVAPVAPSAATSPRFNDGKEANLIAEFNSWNYTYLNKPEVLDRGYRREVSTNELGAILAERNIPRKLAVVKLGWLFNLEDLQDTMDRWNAVLKQMNFERIVFVRPTGSPDLSGALVIYDTQIKNNPPLESFIPKPQAPVTIPVAKEPVRYMRPVRPFASN